MDDDHADRNVADLVRASAALDPEHVALVEGATDTRITWGALDRAVDRAAAVFAGAGVSAGDRVLVRLSGTAAYCVAVFGVLRAGGVLVPIAPGSAPRELDEVLTACGAKVLVADDSDEVAVTAAQASNLRLLPAPDTSDDLPAAAGMTPSTGGEDLAVLAFTSGTSGRARGVMLSHRALLANVVQCSRLRPAPVTAADRVLLALPLFHVYGLGPGLLQVAHAGATAVLAGRFDAPEALTLMARHRVSTVVGVPPMYRAWLRMDHEELRAGFATVRLLTSGAAPLDARLAAAFREATGLGIHEGYGLTETGPVLTSTLVGGRPRPGSVGRAIPGVELRLVHPDGTPLGTAFDTDDDELDDDELGTGLVSARGDNLLSGYWPDADNGPDADGWFRTGDVGFFDTDGDLHLVDRTSDLIIVNGFNVYPHEVERALLELPAVVQAAVVGMPDEDTGETVRAVLVVSGDAPTMTALETHCAVRLARYKIPTMVEVVDELPVTATGKLARRALRALSGEPLNE